MANEFRIRKGMTVTPVGDEVFVSVLDVPFSYRLRTGDDKVTIPLRVEITLDVAQAITQFAGKAFWQGRKRKSDKGRATVGAGTLTVNVFGVPRPEVCPRCNVRHWPSEDAKMHKDGPATAGG